MSPAGVPLFYGALDLATATAEAHKANLGAEAATIGTFRLLRPARVVDLSTPPEVPSLDPERREISQPFVRDDRIHIEYVPTVVTEWLRTRFL